MDRIYEKIFKKWWIFLLIYLITYKEFDVFKKDPTATGRDTFRFVAGSDGSVYFSEDHYETFTRIK